MQIGNAAMVALAVSDRHRQLIARLEHLSAHELNLPSLLPGWTRLTIICHLRYGAEASLVMTRDALEGRTTSFYPEGRTAQRPRTLQPEPGETPDRLIEAFRDASTHLDHVWSGLTADQWNIVVREPADNPDLGPVTLGQLAVLRLTEVEVHGFDLDAGLAPWSETFVHSAFDMRLRWLTTRRSNHRTADDRIRGTWQLNPSNGEPVAISASVEGVSVTPGGDGRPDAQISGSKRDLLAFLLGRLDLSGLVVSGDRGFAGKFHTAFPAP